MGNVSRLLFVEALCALLLFVGGCSSTVQPPSTNSDLVTESDEPEGRTRARRHLTLAVLYFNDGKTTIALDALKQSLAADPNWFEAFNLRGLIYMRLNEVPLAEESFRRALTLNPKAASVQHNYGLLLCQQSRAAEAYQMYASAMANPTYGDRAKTLMALGSCQLGNGLRAEAESSFLKSYELDASNPVTGYNLALLLFERSEYVRAQFYVRRINNSELANSESLWLGIKIERRLSRTDAVQQLGVQLKKRFPQSREAQAYERSAFDE
jgi:type IV pilus assembly protein PilF